MASVEHSNNSLEHTPSGRVLVIDDKPEFERMLRFALEEGGLRVDAASAPPDVLNYLAHVRPDCLVLDLQRAASDGLDLLADVRCRGDLVEVPIVFLAGYGDIDLRWQAVRAGADWFALRPIGMLELQRRVLKLLKTGRPRLRAIAGTSRPHTGSSRLKRTG